MMKENDGDGTTANGHRDCTFLDCMRVARHDHMITSHTWSQSNVYLGAGFCTGFAALYALRYCAVEARSIPAGIYCGIDMDRCKGILKTFSQSPNMSSSVLDCSSSHRMPHGEDACFLMSGLPSTMWDDVFIHSHRQRKDV
jgi:hypothetical protein